LAQNYDAVIFGLDGVLWNTCELRAKAWTEAISQMGGHRVIDSHDIESISGHILADALKELIPTLGEQHFFQVLSVINQTEKKWIEPNPGCIYEGVLETLPQLAQKVPLYLVSSSQQWYAEAFLNHTKTSSYFSDWNSFGRSNRSKEEMIKEIVEKHQLKNPLFIGDTVLDSMAAQRASVKFGFVTYGFGSVKAQPKFEKFSEILNLF